MHVEKLKIGDIVTVTEFPFKYTYMHESKTEKISKSLHQIVDVHPELNELDISLY